MVHTLAMVCSSLSSSCTYRSVKLFAVKAEGELLPVALYGRIWFYLLEAYLVYYDIIRCFRCLSYGVIYTRYRVKYVSTMISLGAFGWLGL